MKNKDVNCEETVPMTAAQEIQTPEGLKGIVNPVGFETAPGCWKEIEVTTGNLTQQGGLKADSGAFRLLPRLGQKLKIPVGRTHKGEYGSSVSACRRIAFWSPVPGAGLRETAVNTAAMLVHTGKADVCLIELEWFNPILHRLLNINKYVECSDGWEDTEYSSLEAYVRQANSKSIPGDILRYVQRHRRHKRLFAATGFYGSTVVANDESFRRESGVLCDFIDRCSAEFDHVILICSPLIDEKTLSRFLGSCNKVYCVIQAELTQLESAIGRICALNDVCYMREERFFTVINKYEPEFNLKAAYIKKTTGYRTAAVISYSHLHTHCRNEGTLFIEKCGSGLSGEYLPIIGSMG